MESNRPANRTLQNINHLKRPLSMQKWLTGLEKKFKAPSMYLMRQSIGPNL